MVVLVKDIAEILSDLKQSWVYSRCNAKVTMTDAAAEASKEKCCNFASMTDAKTRSEALENAPEASKNHVKTSPRQNLVHMIKIRNCHQTSLELLVKVLDVFGDVPVPIESKRRHAKYIILSHCWGTKQTLKTTLANIDDMQQGIYIHGIFA